MREDRRCPCRKGFEGSYYADRRERWSEGAVILNNVYNSTDTNYGFDAANDKYGDMIELGCRPDQGLPQRS